MSLHFYCKNEDNEKEESINNYKDLFLDYVKNPPSLKEALSQIFISGGVAEKELKEYIDDLIDKANHFINKKQRKAQIKEKYPNISENDSLIICSYTCEAKSPDFSPYKILNRNLANENRKEGLQKVSKYLYILLMALRKLPKFYPNEKDKYLYRSIGVQVNTKIDPFRPKLIPYLRNNNKTFWAFSSTSPLFSTAYDFLKNKKNSDSKYGTIFSICGKVWGYDITLFNTYKEEEILLEPERKFFIENVLPDVNDIVCVTCEIKDSPIVLNDLDKQIENKNNNQFNVINYSNYYPIKYQCQMQIQMNEYKKDQENVSKILKEVLSIIEAYNRKFKKKSHFYDHFYLTEFLEMNIKELFELLIEKFELFKSSSKDFIMKYNEIPIKEKDNVIIMLHEFRNLIYENNPAFKIILIIILEQILYFLNTGIFKKNEDYSVHFIMPNQKKKSKEKGQDPNISKNMFFDVSQKF